MDIQPQRLGARYRVTDIRDVNYCYAFAFWRISSRGDFQSIETVAGSYTVEGQVYTIRRRLAWPGASAIPRRGPRSRLPTTPLFS
jgi:hypothetical protein